MADDDAPPTEAQPPKELPLKFLQAMEDFEAVMGDSDKVGCVAFISVDCELCQAVALPAMEEICVVPENEKVVFAVVEVNAAPDIARRANLHSLPSFHCYHSGVLLDSFSGANVDKLKLMLKGALVKRAEALQQKEKQLEEEARVAALAAAAGEEGK